MTATNEGEGRRVPAALGPVLLGLTLVVVEPALASVFAELGGGSVRATVAEIGPWVGLAVYALPFVAFVMIDERLRRALSEPGAGPATRTRLAGVRAFGLGFAQTLLCSFGGLQVVLWLEVIEAPAPWPAVVAVTLMGGALWGAVWWTRWIAARAYDGAGGAGPGWLARAPRWALAGGIWLWSVVGVGALWFSLIGSGKIGMHDPSVGEVAATALPLAMFFTLFYLPWRYPEHLRAATRAGGAPSVGRELLDVGLVFAIVYAPIAVTALVDAPLYRAAAKGDAAALRALAADGADLTRPHAGGETLLHAAARRGHVEAVEVLVAAGASPNARRGDYRTPFHVALERGEEEVAGRLLAAGADAAMVGRLDRAPLHLAAEGDMPAIVAALIAAGAEVDARDRRGDTPLHAAARASLESAAHLLRAGADPRVENDKGETPRDRARLKSRRLYDALVARFAEQRGEPRGAEPATSRRP